MGKMTLARKAMAAAKVVRTVKAAKAIAAPAPSIPGIALPDSPIRQKMLWQVICRMPRPFLDWVAVAGAAHAFGLLDGFGLFTPADDARSMIILAFVGSLYGVRTFEKAKGVA
jgi:hypothetical protein